MCVSNIDEYIYLQPVENSVEAIGAYFRYLRPQIELSNHTVQVFDKTGVYITR